MQEWVEAWSHFEAPPRDVSPAWLTEILTSCFEHHVLPSYLSSSSLSSAPAYQPQQDDEDDEGAEDQMWKLRERDLMAFLDRYITFLDHERLLFFCNTHRLSLCISFFLHTEQILLHQTAALTPASPATAAAQYLLQLWQALNGLLQSHPDVRIRCSHQQRENTTDFLTLMRRWNKSKQPRKRR